MSASDEIRTVEEFRALTSQPFGVVVVEDRPTSVVRAHTSSCAYVTEAYFTTKVIDGAGKNGRYFFFLRFDDAASEIGAEACSVCGGAADEATPSTLTIAGRT